MNPLSAPMMYVLMGLCVILGGTAIVQTLRLSHEREAHAETKANHAKVLAHLAQLTAEASEAVRSRETRIRGMLDASNTAREQGIANAVENEQKRVAGLLDGTRRLREQWRQCESAAKVSGDAAPGPGPDAAARVRAEAAGRVVRVGDDADNQVRGLQQYARACQALTRDEE